MHKVLVLGAGNIGTAIAVMLSEESKMRVDRLRYEVTIADKEISPEQENFFKIHHVNTTSIDVVHDLERYLTDNEVNVIVSALPYSLNIHVGTLAIDHQIHYFDLTEDVTVKKTLQKLSYGKDSIVMPQCGLAPGFINILGGDLIRSMDQVYNLKIRVGALPQKISNSLKYAITWSDDGLINEYLNECEAIVNGKLVNNIQPLSDIETTIIDGVEYEAFNTSGGLGTLAETYHDIVQNMNYKTIRYPGHCEKMRFFLFDLQPDRETAKQILRTALPTTDQDVIIIYGSVSGMRNGRFIEDVQTFAIKPTVAWENYWTGIKLTTATGCCAVMDITLNGTRKDGSVHAGFIKQEEIDLKDFKENDFGKMYF